MHSEYLLEIDSTRPIDAETRILLKDRIGNLVRETVGGSAVPHITHLGLPVKDINQEPPPA